MKNEIRNQLIVDDVVECHQKGKNCIVLSERVEHVKILSEMLRQKIPDAISVTGGMGNKGTRETMQKINESSIDKPLTMVATGRFIGEGFDEPRLDSLFLAMPISWKGTLQQYAGRLHRLFEGKKEALIFDYIDIHVRMFERMYNRRLSGYASIWTEATKNIAAGIQLVFKPNTHQKFAIIDQKIVWYGSINLLNYGSAEESMMRIESNKIAYELLGSVGENE